MKNQTFVSISAFIGVLIGIGFMLFSTTPERVGPLGILIFFLLVFLLFFIMFDYIWRLATSSQHQPKYNLYFIAVLAGIPTVLMALQSLRQLEMRDVAIVVILAVIVIFYLSRTARNPA